jgi:hypothetical protein
MEDPSRWHGYDVRDIYRAQDDCLIKIADGDPIRTKDLQRIPPLRALLLARIAKAANTNLEQGTFKQLADEAIAVGNDGKLGEWWNR